MTNDMFVGGEEAYRVENSTAVLRQLHTGLAHFTGGDAHDIVIKSRKNPLEAWRRYVVASTQPLEVGNATS